MPEHVVYTQPHDPEMLRLLAERLEPSGSVVQTGAPDERTTVLITGYPSLDELSAAPNLRALIIPFAGIPPKTRELMSKFPNIEVHNLHHNAPETAELAVALMLACAKSIIPMDRSLRAGDWTPRYDPSLAIRLEGRTAVIIGYGAVGSRIGRACMGLGMRVIGHRRSCGEEEMDIRGPADLSRSLKEAEVLILAVPHTTETAAMIGPAELAMMKSGSILVNIARAGLVNEEALYLALKERRLRSAGLDVWYRYPESDAAKGYLGYIPIGDVARATMPSALPFHELENVVMSPHRGGTSADVERARVEALAELLASDPMPNRVDLDRGY